MKICPICDTENQPQATNCEVCGERLTPPAAGEQLAPEESVLGLIGHSPDPPTDESPPLAPEVTSATDEDEDISEEELLRQFAELEARSEESRAAAIDLQTAPTLHDEPPVHVPQPRHRPVGTAPELITHGVATARLVVYQNKQPVHTHPIVNDETLLGRYDAISGSEPDLDLTPWDDDAKVSRKHAWIYRVQGEYFVCPLSTAGTQVGNQIVEPGTQQPLCHGDVVVLSMALAMKFETDDA